MLKLRNATAGFAVVALGAGAVGAQVHIGEPIILQDRHNVSVHYMSASSPLDGVLWLAGSSTPTGADIPLFFNRSGELGFEHDLGTYQAGARLDFIYDVLTGLPDSFRTDDPLEALQYRWRWDTPDIILVELDDVRLPMGDADYNDIRFEVRFHAIPATTSTAAVAVALIPFFGRRRQR
jgi:hypothetical protein